MMGLVAVLLVLCGTWTHKGTVLSVDGKKGAPIRAAQYPTLLDKYRSRPPWNVAGVDYAVGYAAPTVSTIR